MNVVKNPVWGDSYCARYRGSKIGKAEICRRLSALFWNSEDARIHTILELIEDGVKLSSDPYDKVLLVLATSRRENGETVNGIHWISSSCCSKRLSSKGKGSAASLSSSARGHNDAADNVGTWDPALVQCIPCGWEITRGYLEYNYRTWTSLGNVYICDLRMR